MKKFTIFFTAFFLAFIGTMAGCEFEVDPGVDANVELVYTLVGEGEQAYYIVGNVASVADADLGGKDVDDLDYEQKAAIFGSYGGSLATVTVPAEHEGLPVKGVGAYAFYLCSAVQINLPETIEFIAEEAFRNCPDLESVVVGSREKGSSLKRIGDAAFRACRSLTTVYLWGETVPQVQTFASQTTNSPFYSTSYPAVVVPNEQRAQYVSDVVWSVYSDYVVSQSSVYTNGQIIENGKLVKYTGHEVVVTITDVVKIVGQYAFKGNELKQVNFPYGVEEIGRQAFYGCKQLVTYTFKDGSCLTAIGNNAFEGCVSLKTAVIPQSVTVVKDKAFAGCTSMDTIFIQSTTIGFIYTNVFGGCTVLENVYFAGDADQFAAIDIRKGNEPLTEANFIWNYTDAPILPEQTVSPDSSTSSEAPSESLAE